MSISIDIVGLDALIAELAALDLETQVRAEAAVAAATQDAQQVAINLCPVETGTLQAGNLIRAIGGASLILGELYNNVYYAPFVVFGHHTRSWSFVPPNDFFTPAMAAGRESLMQRLAGIVGM